MKIKINNIKSICISLYFFVMMILLCQCFYLFPYSIGNIAFYDIPLVLLSVLIIFFGLKYFTRKNLKQMDFLLPVFMLFISILFSLLSSKWNYNQGITITLLQQRHYYMFALAYIPAYFMFKKNLINTKSIGSLIIIIGIIEFIIYSYQALMYPKVQILNCMISVRYFTRLYVDSIIIELMIIISMCRVFNDNGKINFIYFIPAIIGFIHVAFISQGRLETIICTLTIILSIILWKKAKLKKWIMFTIILLVTLIIVFENGIFDLFTSQRDTMSIRKEGRELFLEQLTKDPFNFIFGVGYPYSDNARNISGITQGIAANDNGLYGYMYMYGVFGILTILIFFIKSLIYSIGIFKNSGNRFPILFLFFNLGICYTITFWWWKPEWAFFFGCFFAYIENEYKNLMRTNDD